MQELKQKETLNKIRLT